MKNKYDIQFTGQFKRDFKLAKKQHRNLDRLFKVIDVLAAGGTLDEKYRDHALTGNYKGTRECHVEPDCLLIYEIRQDVLAKKSKRRSAPVLTLQKHSKKRVGIFRRAFLFHENAVPHPEFVCDTCA